MRQLTALVLAVALAIGSGKLGAKAADLAPPFAVTAGGRVIDAPLGDEGRPLHDNDYPWVGDFDGDGKPDLLVGQHTYQHENGKTGGRLRVYANTGERGRPQFGAPVWFDDKNPTGRIPGG